MHKITINSITSYITKTDLLITVYTNSPKNKTQSFIIRFSNKLRIKAGDLTKKKEMQSSNDTQKEGTVTSNRASPINLLKLLQ